jgi:hypothetical protein
MRLKRDVLSTAESMWLSLLQRKQDKLLGPNDRDILDALIMKKQGLQTVRVEKAFY